MRTFIIITLLAYSFSLLAQGNCQIYPEDSGERKACELSYKALEYRQGSKESQMIFDTAISIGPKYPFAYMEKSVPYFKRGFLHEGLQLLNKAIELDPLEYLPYRASWYWQYDNHKLCIKDLEKFYNMRGNYAVFTPGGEANMKLILALSYVKSNNLKKGIETIEELINTYKSESDVGMPDYYLLGVLYYKNKQYNKAIAMFKKQFKIMNDFPACHYYLGLSYKMLAKTKMAKSEFNKALSILNSESIYHISIARLPVYKDDIIKELKQ